MESIITFLIWFQSLSILLFCKKRLKSYVFICHVVAVFLLFCAVNAVADDFKDFAELDLEEMLNTEITTASRTSQKLYEAPNAVYVITEEEIKRSGAVDLPDLFRMVPGVDVVSIYGNSYGVSARGFNERFAQRMLMMIDGRSIYTTFFGGVFWEDEEVFLEDIKRIEVIRGPGATLWGANSVNGVINIITKDPEDDQGIMLTSKAGSKYYRDNVFRYSDSVSEALSFSITGGYREDEGTRGVHDFRRVPKATGRLKYRFSEDSVLNVFAGVNESVLGLDVTKYQPRTDTVVRSNYQMLRWEYRLSLTSQFQIQAYHGSFVTHSKDNSILIEEDKYDVEIQHSFALGRINQIIWGANYRNTRVDSNLLLPETDQDNLAGFFVQDEIDILDNLKFILGIKYEKNSFTGGDYSPRGSVLYSPWPDHHFRFAVSRAFRTPSFVENSFSIVKTLPSPLAFIPLARVNGNEDLEPERMTAFEIGYRSILFNTIALNIELYYNEMDRVVENVVTRKMWPLKISWDNEFNVIAKGIEIAADLPLTPWWTLKANYTFQEVEYKRLNNDVPGTPKHKFNLGSSFVFQNGFSLNMTAHYVDDTKWKGLTGNVKVDKYVRFDVRASQKLFSDKLELSLTGQNLLDKLHPETNDGTDTYESERLIYGQVTLRFN